MVLLLKDFVENILKPLIVEIANRFKANEADIQGKEDLSNKSIDQTFTSPNNNTYPTTLAVKTYIDTAISNLSIPAANWEVWEQSGTIALPTNITPPAGVLDNKITVFVWYDTVIQDETTNYIINTNDIELNVSYEVNYKIKVFYSV